VDDVLDADRAADVTGSHEMIAGDNAREIYRLI
jgi:hypothetical protein